MSWPQRLSHWLESHWVTPAFAGWLLGSLALFFLLAAANTLAGWLYVISGVSLALLIVAAVLPVRSLHQVQLSRHPLHPVSAGDLLAIELRINNPTPQLKSLLQVTDQLPAQLGRAAQTAVEEIAPQSNYSWRYTVDTSRRGVYHWQTVQLRTAAPLGLFWCQRSRSVPATAVVYPTVLNLTHCPLIDDLGQELHPLQQSQSFQARMATEGSTRSLRPYRWGDPTRLVHWRTSARYGELRVRELEVFTGGLEVVIGLDSSSTWHPDDFEQAVIAAASLYFYARHQNPTVQLWTAGTGVIHGEQSVLTTLAQVEFGEPVQALPSLPLIWLTQNPVTLGTLPLGSRWCLWSSDRLSLPSEAEVTLPGHQVGIVVQPEEPLQLQLQSLPRRG